MSNFTKETYDQGLSDIKSGKVFHFGGRSAVTVEDLDFIAQVEGLDKSAPKTPAKTDAEKAKAIGGTKAPEKKDEPAIVAPVVPPAAPAVKDDAETKKQEAEKLVADKLAALNAAKTDAEKAKATKEYEEAQKALLDLG
jgi:hypothetical protein